MDKKICEEVLLVDNILKAEDFVRLRIEAGFVEVPVDHARKALQNGLINVSAKGKEPFYKEMGFDIISNGLYKIIETK